MTITTRDTAGGSAQPLFLPGVVEQRPSPLAESGIGLELPTGYHRSEQVEAPRFDEQADEVAFFGDAPTTAPQPKVKSFDEAIDESFGLTDPRAREPFQLIGAEALAAEPLDEVKPAKRVGNARKPFSLIDPNQAWVMWVGAALNTSVLIASLVLSFSAVYYSAAWIGIPTELQWLAVIMLDVAIVGFSWGLMVFSSRAADLKYAPDSDSAKKKRQRMREATGRTRFFLIMVTLMSVVANVMKTWDYWEGDLSTPQAIFGVVYSASIPLWALAATEEVIRMIFARRKRVYEEGLGE